MHFDLTFGEVYRIGHSEEEWLELKTENAKLEAENTELYEENTELETANTELSNELESVETLLEEADADGESITEKTTSVIKLADSHKWFQEEMVDTQAVCWIFNGHSDLTRVPAFDFSMIKDFTDMFGYCSHLEVIEYIDFSSAVETSGMFNSCSKLTEIRLAPESLKVSITIPSRKLSDESIQSIINGLATVEEPQTLNLHSEVSKKLTAEQIQQMTDKNWY